MQVRTIALTSVSLLIAGLWLRGCKDDQTLPMSQAPASVKPLGPEDQLHVSYRRNRITVQTQDEVKTAYVPDAGKTAVTVKTDGTVSVDIKNKGVTFEPGFGVLFGERTYFAVDAQLLYWNRCSAGIGLGAAPHSKLVGFVNGAYRLDQLKMPNTSLYVAFTNEKQVSVGIRWRF